MNEQMYTFAIFAPKKHTEDNYLLAVTSYGASNTVFIETFDEKSFSISTPGNWKHTVVEETIVELKNHWTLDLKRISNHM